MLLKIDFESETPIYTQLRNQIIEGIAKRELVEGDSLPSVRQLAEDIGINLHTVNKAYNVLKQEGFLKLDRRKGAVIGLSFNSTEDEIVKRLKEELQPVLAEAFCKRVSREKVGELLKELYEEYEGDAKT